MIVKMGGALKVLLLSLSVLHLMKAQAVTLPSNIEAKMKSLFTSSGTNASLGSTFAITFTLTSFNSLPNFGFGINDFNVNNNFTRISFLSQTTNLTSGSVGIKVTYQNTTKITKFSISYISIWNHGGIFVLSNTYTNMTNLTTGPYGDRYYQVQQVYIFANSQISVVHFMRGFYFTSSVASQVHVDVSIISTASYLVKISTTSDCHIQYVYLDILFFYTGSVTNATYVYSGNTLTYSQTTANINAYTRYIVNYTTTACIIALGGFYVFNFATTVTTGWSVSNVSSNTATLQFNRPNMQDIYYSYFQIGYIVPIANNTTPGNPEAAGNAASPEKSSYLGIIVGLIVGVLVISVAIVVIVKFYFKPGVFVTPEKNDFRILPSLSL